MLDNVKNRIQKLFKIIDMQLQKIDMVFSTIENELVIKQSTGNLKLGEPKINSDDDLSVISENYDFEEIEYLRQEVEFLRELKNSFHALLLHKDQQLQEKDEQLQELASELKAINQEIMSAFSAPHLTFEDTNQELYIELQELITTSSNLAATHRQLQIELQKGIKNNIELRNYAQHLKTKV